MKISRKIMVGKISIMIQMSKLNSTICNTIGIASKIPTSTTRGLKAKGIKKINSIKNRTFKIRKSIHLEIQGAGLETKTRK
jgi:hypothetical protein